MNILNPSITHPSFSSLITRFFKILRRYGLSSKKMESNLKLYLAILQEYGVLASFSIPGNVLSKHQSVIKDLADNNVEFAIHGYEHVDYTRLSHEELLQHFEKAIEIFQQYNIPFSGFRFPYLRYDHRFIDISDKYSFVWDSSHTILWDVIDNTLFSNKNTRNYQHMLHQYDYKSSSDYLSLPKFSNNFVEIPISLPDDDLLERLGITENDAAEEIWGQILIESHVRGELFTLQLHPERIFMFEDALRSVIQTAQGLYPRVWLASLSSISDWWKEKKGFTIELNSKGDFEYEVVANCSPRATLLVRSPDFQNDQFIHCYSYVKERTFLIKSPRRPIVGIPKYSSPNLMQFLKNEGFIFEVTEDKENYSVYLAGLTSFSEEHEMKTLEIIHSTNLPLVRFWRWPNGCRSALSITGDIDGLTSIDFLFRVFALPA